MLRSREGRALVGMPTIERNISHGDLEKGWLSKHSSSGSLGDSSPHSLSPRRIHADLEYYTSRDWRRRGRPAPYLSSGRTSLHRASMGCCLILVGLGIAELRPHVGPHLSHFRKGKKLRSASASLHPTRVVGTTDGERLWFVFVGSCGRTISRRRRERSRAGRRCTSLS